MLRLTDDEVLRLRAAAGALRQDPPCAECNFLQGGPALDSPHGHRLRKTNLGFATRTSKATLYTAAAESVALVQLATRFRVDVPLGEVRARDPVPPRRERGLVQRAARDPEEVLLRERVDVQRDRGLRVVSAGDGRGGVGRGARSDARSRRGSRACRSKPVLLITLPPPLRGLLGALFNPTKICS